MSNKIQIKRSTSNSVITGLSNGELAFTQASNTLWIGLPDGSGYAAIAGVRNPGVLTANQALVANSSSAIDKIVVANLVPTSVFANGSVGTLGQVLLSGGNGANVYWGTGTSGSNTQVQFNDSGVANAVSGFTFNKDSNTLSVSNTINVGLGGFTANGTLANAYALNVVNQTNTATLFVTTTANVGSNVQISTSTIFVGNDIVNTSITAGSITFSGFSINSTSYTGTANNANYLGGVIAASYVQNTDSRVLSGNLTFSGTNTVFNSNVSLNGANVYITGSNTSISANVRLTGANTYISSNLTFTGANIDATSAMLNVRDVVVGGNLTINGTLTTVNTNNLVVKDNMVSIASNNTTSDTLDSGFYVSSNTDGIVRYSGLARFFADSTSSMPVFKLFTTTVEPTGTISSSSLGTLQAYIISQALVSNQSGVTITANSTVYVNITANTLSLATALAATSGGTGQNTYTSGDILVANTGNALSKLALGSSGYVLQSNGTALVYDILDGGTF